MLPLNPHIESFLSFNDNNRSKLSMGGDQNNQTFADQTGFEFPALFNQQQEEFNFDQSFMPDVSGMPSAQGSKNKFAELPP